MDVKEERRNYNSQKVSNVDIKSININSDLYLIYIKTLNFFFKYLITLFISENIILMIWFESLIYT